MNTDNHSVPKATNLVVALDTAEGDLANQFLKARKQAGIEVIYGADAFAAKLAHYGIHMPRKEQPKSSSKPPEGEKRRSGAPGSAPPPARASSGGGGGGGASWVVTRVMETEHANFFRFTMHNECGCGSNLVVLTRTVPGSKRTAALGFPYLACARKAANKYFEKNGGAAGGAADDDERAAKCKVPKNADVAAFFDRH